MRNQAPRPYYYILAREPHGWTVQFGDYDRKVVAQELEDSYVWRYRHDELRWPRKDLEIFKCSDLQANIVAILEERNSKLENAGV